MTRWQFQYPIMYPHSRILLPILLYSNKSVHYTGLRMGELHYGTVDHGDIVDILIDRGACIAGLCMHLLCI